MKLSGAEIIIECLKEQKTEVIFGYPGGTVLSVYDALARRGKSIKHVLTAHEQGAAHAADGYARATGRTGVCLVTSGPGATNLVTGIATAYMDSVPLVAITINVATSSLGKDSFQEVDIAGVTMPVTKHNFIVKDICSLAPVIRRAFSIASEGRPGPVLVDITKDVTENICEYKKEEPDLNKPEIYVTQEEIDAAVRLIAAAKRPVMLVGGGAVISGAAPELRALSDTYGLFVADTLMGKGVIDSRSPRYLGMAGMYGRKCAAYALEHADLIIAVGTRFSERMTDAADDIGRHKILQIDIDRAELNKNVSITLGLAGDGAVILRRILRGLDGRELSMQESWSSNLQTRAEKERFKLFAGNSRDALTGEKIVSTVSASMPEDAIVSTEVGLNQMWAADGYTFTYAGQLLTSGGLGTMGYGLGAAIGAGMGCPGRRIVNFAGDGCFRMNMNELITAASYKIPVIEIIFDNGTLGMVHDMQKKNFGERFTATELSSKVDYVAAARALGADGALVSTVSELEGELKKALKHKGPYVIVCDMQGHC